MYDFRCYRKCFYVRVICFDKSERKSRYLDNMYYILDKIRKGDLLHGETL